MRSEECSPSSYSLHPSLHTSHCQSVIPLSRMCKTAAVPVQPVTEVADKIKNSTNIDNSWSFFNFHLPSSTFTAAAILVIAITAWLMFRSYRKYCGPLTPQAGAAITPSPPTTQSMPVILNMEQLLNATNQQATTPFTSNIQAAGPLPPRALLFS